MSIEIGTDEWVPTGWALGDGVSFGDDENVVQLDSSDG
jgi:hypothetical protein